MMCNYLLLIGKYYIIKTAILLWRNSVKKFSKFIICLCLMCSFVFAGCNLVQRNTDRYLNRTVATIGNEITITKKDLITAYNSYGYQYVQNYGYTAEKALKTTLDGLIDRQLVLTEAKKFIKVDDETKQVYYVTYNTDGTEKSRELIYNKNVWQNEIKKQVYDGINEQIASLEKTIRKELGIEEETSDDDTKKNTYDAEKVYEKKVKYEDGKWSNILTDISKAEEPIGDFVQNDTGDKSISEKAYKRYIKQLVSNEKGKNLSTKENEVLAREIDRVYKIYEDNKYISDFETQFEHHQTIDNELNGKIVEYYKNLVLASYEKYKELGEQKGYEQYCKDMKDDSSKVFYHPVENKFVEVSHVLIKLSDEQTSQIKDLDSKLKTGEINQEQHDYEYQRIIDQTVVYARDEDGKETSTKKTVDEVYREINNELSKYSTVEEKAVAFNKFIYKYNQDTGIINKENYYVVNLDTSVEDAMVKNFADKSRELAKKNPQGGNLSEPVFVSSDNYSGFHIIFNAGVVNNDLSIDQVKNLDASYAIKLYNKKLMLGADKTYYDYIYDTIVSSAYSSYTKSITNTLKQNLQVTIYVDAYKDLY